jgi:hypothetical protein
LNDKWNVNIDINKYITSGLRKLDYGIEFAEDRNKLAWDILNELDQDGTLSSYFSSDGFRMKQVKTKNSFLSESEPVSKLLLRFSYYIDFAKYNDIEAKIKEEKDKLHTLSAYKSNKRSDAIGLSDELQKLNGKIIDFDFQNQATRKDKNIRLVPKQTITAKDRMEYPELNEYALFLEMINETLGFVNGVSKEKQLKIHEKIVKKHGDNYLRMLKKVRSELLQELPLIKDRIRGTIYFKKLDKGSPVYDLDCDTGYVNEQGDYVEISENKIELNNPQHLFALMDNYAELKEGVWDKPDSDLWVLLHEFENLVEKSELEPYEKDILIYKIDKMTGEDICLEINSKYEMELKESNLVRIYSEVIPKKLVSTHDDIYEEWLYTYRVKGKYKQCKKCGANKVLNERNFYKEPKGKDGFKSTCIKCM